ncbi:hypothetical protein WJX73_005247 [Symbiochloris irregularis]|uniref:Uncharacterized protein n=1 Tax=Symbiochloris irregularis TaxID=706552 RepID=A0AAW1PE85_9CHLO
MKCVALKPHTACSQQPPDRSRSTVPQKASFSSRRHCAVECAIARFQPAAVTRRAGLAILLAASFRPTTANAGETSQPQGQDQPASPSADHSGTSNTPENQLPQQQQSQPGISNPAARTSSPALTAPSPSEAAASQNRPEKAQTSKPGLPATPAGKADSGLPSAPAGKAEEGPSPAKSTPNAEDLSAPEVKRLLAEEEERRKLRRRRKGRLRELEEMRAELAEKELVLLEREQEVLEREQTVGTLREQLEIEKKLRTLLTKEKQKAEEEAALAMGMCGGALLP